MLFFFLLFHSNVNIVYDNLIHVDLSYNLPTKEGQKLSAKEMPLLYSAN